MASAVGALTNASVVFQLPIAGTTTDDYGNVIPNTEAVTVQMYLRQGDLQERDLEGTGVSAATDVLEGYATVPQALDSRIKAGTRGAITFAGQPASACAVSQAAFPYGNTGLIGSTIQRVLGDKIRLVRFSQYGQPEAL